ncbi:hypothetical protein A5N15_03675 [Rothia kristinae]|uniref:MmyB-like transcription regulator ligand binding domain-containing protein n=1 Tax=Rothia kristinae TaxID=37923 RepID=A0A657IVB4_9MICC|nr:hypothetical protein A5N15_03675 [Rothia kristinae]
MLTRTGDLLAATPPAEALFPGMDEWPPHRRNIIRYLFLAPAARTLYPEDWEVHARHCIAGLRSLAGTDPQDAALAELVEELRRDSEEFAALWQAYDVRTHAQAVKVLHHPVVGRVALDFQAMSIEGTPGQRLSVYSAAPGTSGARGPGGTGWPRGGGRHTRGRMRLSSVPGGFGRLLSLRRRFRSDRGASSSPTRRSRSRIRGFWERMRRVGVGRWMSAASRLRAGAGE